jgi:hypothetical protein
MCIVDTDALAAGIYMGNELGAGYTDMELRIDCESGIKYAVNLEIGLLCNLYF